MACVDGLSGFPEAIRAAYPETSVQLCIVHLVRAALRYVSSEDSKQVVCDLKKIYQSATVMEAESALEEFAQAWDAKYPMIAKTWRAKWTDIITLFDFPPPIRKVPFFRKTGTTNAIESVNSVIRKFPKNRKIYPSGQSALKLIYMAIRATPIRMFRFFDRLTLEYWRHDRNTRVRLALTRHRSGGPARSATGNRHSTTSPSCTKAACPS